MIGVRLIESFSVCIVRDGTVRGGSPSHPRWRRDRGENLIRCTPYSVLRTPYVVCCMFIE